MAALSRLSGLVLAAGALALGTAAEARPALYFLFDPTGARPGEQVTLRTVGTPKDFQPSDGVRPLQGPMRLYLVRNADAGKIRSRFDSRLHFIGSLRSDRNGRGSLTFTAPPLESGRYAAAAWCPECARFSRGPMFFVLGVGAGTVPRYRPHMLLLVTAPRATADRCPVTNPSGEGPPGLKGNRWYGNGTLWVDIPPNGVLEVGPAQVRADGSMFDKPGWFPTDITGVLAVRGRRIDAQAPPLRVLGVNWGYASDGRGSWRSAISFSSEGCWKLTGRVRDVTLSYVIKVVRKPSA